jgi:16S rRNA (uracil1498-N3)-methyltransferase
LPADQAHHARDVLRLTPGDEVELFTPMGQVARAIITQADAAAVIAQVESVDQTPPTFELTIASAVPKAARSDWMIEKLSELGVSRFIPLQTDRSVVHPEGRGKIERWERLAAESAKQSRRAGVMTIDPLTVLRKLLDAHTDRIAFLSTAPGAVPLPSILKAPSPLTLLVGPEGGWSDAELAAFAERDLTPITLGATILRVETAAIAAAAVVAALSSTLV